MAEKKITLLDLIGNGEKLGEFRVLEYTEIFRTDDDGRKTKSIGFIKNDDVAKAFAGVQTDANWCRTERVILLTDGDVGFVLSRVNNPSLDSVKIIQDENALLEVREKALKKLSQEEKRALGLG